MSLAVIGASKAFGATRALVDVSLTLHPGTTLALIGENGAGKSTLIKVLAGACAADTGSLTWAGQPLSINSPADALHAGIAVLHQDPQFVDTLCVLDNLFMGRTDFSARGGWVRTAALRARAEHVFDSYGYRVPLEGLGRDLTPSARTLLALTRCLLDAPRVLVLDEPTASLGHAEVDILGRVVQRLTAHGCAVLFVSHRLDEVLNFAPQVAVMRNGRLVAQLAASGQTRASLIAHMSGGSQSAGVGPSVETLLAATTRPPTADREPILEVESLTTADGRVDAVSFNVRRGEIVCLYGLAGAGRTELLEALYGVRPRRGGVVRIAGKALGGTVRQALRHGVRLVPENRKRQALLPASVRDNLQLGLWHRFARAGVIDANRESEHASHAIDRFQIRATGLSQHITELSGGNQQKVVFARSASDGREFQRPSCCSATSRPRPSMSARAGQSIA